MQESHLDKTVKMDPGYKVINRMYETTTSASNNTTPMPIQDIIGNTGFLITLVVFHILAMIIAALGNGSVIVFIMKYRRMRSNTTAYLVLNLAICDFTIAVLHTPMRLVDILVPKHDGSVHITIAYCQVSGFFTSLISGVGYYTVALISLERFLLICYPLQTKGMLSISRTLKVLAGVWALSFFAALPLPICFTFVTKANINGQFLTFCMNNFFGKDNLSGQMYYLFLFFFYFLVPVCTITFAYVRIFVTLHKNEMENANVDGVMQKVMMQRKRLAKVMLSVAIVFTVLHTPYFVTFLFISFGFPIPNNPITTLLIIEYLSLLNACFNPFIYSAYSRTFFRRKMMAFLSTNDEETQRKKSSSPSLNRGSYLNRQSSQNPEAIWIKGVTDADADVEV